MRSLAVAIVLALLAAFFSIASILEGGIAASMIVAGLSFLAGGYAVDARSAA